MPTLLLVATTAALELAELAIAVELAGPEGVGVATAPGLLAPAQDGDVRDGALARGDVVVVVAPASDDLLSHAA